jgi:hypothetical protein
MATKSSEDQDSTLLEEFLARNTIDREDLGEPPLADSQDPFLDRERVHLDIDEENEDDN